MRIAMISDTQWKTWKKNNEFSKHIEEAFKLFLEEAIKRKVDFVVHGGDFYENKNFMSVQCLWHSSREVKKIADSFPLFIIIGNHDTVYKDHKINLLSNFNNYKNVKVYDDYSFFDKGNARFHFLPFFTEEEIIKKLETVKYHPTLKNYLFGHFGVNSFTYQEDGYTDPQMSILPKHLEKFDYVFLGHFHSFQQKGNIVYISSPFQFAHGDERGKHGFVFLDTDENTFEFVENPTSPKFITIELNKENIQQIFSLENHFIRLVINKAISGNALQQLREKLMQKNYDVAFKYNFIEENKIPTIQGWDEIITNEPEDIIRKFVEKIPDDSLKFSKKELLDVLFV